MNITNFKKKLEVGQKVFILSPYQGMSRETVITKVQTDRIATPSTRNPGENCYLTLPKASEITEITDSSVKFIFKDMPEVGEFGIALL